MNKRNHCRINMPSRSLLTSLAFVSFTIIAYTVEAVDLAESAKWKAKADAEAAKAKR